MMNGNATFEAAKAMMKAMRKDDGSFKTYDEMKAEGLPTVFEATYSNTGNRRALRTQRRYRHGPIRCDIYVRSFYGEVEVDTATGKRRYSASPAYVMSARSQYRRGARQGYGGISHSIGFALDRGYEDVKSIRISPPPEFRRLI
jgi:aldehyde oxidoreductase